MSVSKDSLRRFIFEGEDILGSFVRLGDVWQSLRSADDYPEALQNVVGEAAAATALLGRSLKFDGRLTFQVQGGDPVFLLVMQTNHELVLRGLARWSNEAYGELAQDSLPTFKQLVNGGQFSITVEAANNPERYQSIVPVTENVLEGCLQHYYEQSVQLPTILLLSADEERAAGIMFQAMPERKSGSGRWRQLVDELAGLDVLKMSGLEDSVLLSTLFPEDDIRLFDPEPVSFNCDCSMEKIENVLRMFGKEELENLLSEPGAVEVRCEFCNELYEVELDRVRELIAEVAPGGTQPLH